MVIERGTVFRGNKNGREVKILSANAIQVRYRDLKYGTVFAVGRELFERLDITRVFTPSDDDLLGIDRNRQ